MRKIYEYCENGNPDVTVFLNSAPQKLKKKFNFVIEQIKNGNKPLYEPYVKHFSIERFKLFYELRLKSMKTIIRIIFIETNGNIILLHAFYKRNKRDTQMALEQTSKGGIYYGINAVSHNLLICNRKLLLNGNGFILGVSGSGKSFATKMEIALAALFTNDDIIIADPEREYSPLTVSMGGEVIRLSAASTNYINALEMDKSYGDGENPIALKSEFLMSLFDQLLRDDKFSRMGGGIGPKDKSIIDRCTLNVYKEYLKDFSTVPPTLIDFRNELLNQSEPEAKDLALALELFTEGSLNIFAHQSSVDINKRIVCYDILELGTQLKSVGLLIMLDNILNRVIENRKRGKYTRVYIDEAHLFFANPFSAQFLSNAWLRFRKYGGLVTGITQNVEKCLKSETARTMLANSEFLLMLNQAATDRIELSKILNISDMQMSYITNAPAGCGLVKVGGSIVPFINDFPNNIQLYNLMTTKPGES